MTITRLKTLALYVAATGMALSLAGGYWSAVAANDPALAPQAVSAPRADAPTPRTIPSVEEVVSKLGERQKSVKSLYAEYSVTTSMHCDPKRLVSWLMITIKDYKYEHKVAFAGTKRYKSEVMPGVLEFIQPIDEITIDPDAPTEFQKHVASIRDYAKQETQKRNGPLPKLPGWGNESIYDGAIEWWRPQKGIPFGRPVDGIGSPMFRGYYHLVSPYLEAIGLRPPSPVAHGDQLQTDQAHWLPDGLNRYAKVTVLPKQEAVKGSPCIVLKAERKVKGDEDPKSWLYGKEREEVETLWLDPALGYAPRKREITANGVLMERWENLQFAEAAPGCWLPKESHWTQGTPVWSAQELRNKAALTYTMKVKKLQLNDVADDVFRPK